MSDSPMTPHPTGPISDSESGAEEQARAIVTNKWYVKEIAAALRQSADTARDKALGEAQSVAEGYAKDCADGLGFFNTMEDLAGSIADAIAALRSSQDSGK